ncbi:hypothetical protein GYMLUDRAFT_80829 [Collybiopsis luxurians FD-317 M1]|nr:hypothetical protein GYMLUDRAFT_80829 [Collybiopsis luxurians FD-317 M1]
MSEGESESEKGKETIAGMEKGRTKLEAAARLQMEMQVLSWSLILVLTLNVFFFQLLTPGKFSISIPAKKPESTPLPRSSIQLQGEAFQVQTSKVPPQPASEPPPPPPPDRSPPPIPPPNSPPPPPPPTNSPPPPPPSNPPPPPPPPSLPPPPTPPEPPMPVLTDLRVHPSAPSITLTSHNAISIALPTSRAPTSTSAPTPAQIQMQPAKASSPSSPTLYSLPPPPPWPPSRHQLPHDVRPHRVIYDPTVALIPAHDLGSKDAKEKEKEARLERDRATERAALISGYVKPGLRSQKPAPPTSEDLDLISTIDIDSSKGEGTSTGAGTLAGALYGRSSRGGKEKSSGSEYFDVLFAAIRRSKNHQEASSSYPRIQGKGKGKESITRYDGEVLAGGDWFWVPDEDVQGGSSSALATSTSTSVTPTISPTVPVALPATVSSSASAFLAKFRSSTESVAHVGSAIPGKVDEERGYWICERLPVPQDPRIVKDRDKENEGGTQDLYLREREKRTRTQFYMLDNYEVGVFRSTSRPVL